MRNFSSKRLLEAKRLDIDLGQSFTIEPTLDIYNPHPEIFKRSIYEKVGRLNNEEYRLAKAIDDLPNIKWWFRNSDRNGFYIQGYLPHSFNPDFILETKTGCIIAVEYKGEHLADREYKERSEIYGAALMRNTNSSWQQNQILRRK